MKFGVLFRVQDPPNGENIGRRMRECLHAATVAEDAGFDGVFVPEHHMMDDGYLPSPLTFIGALSSITERIDIGSTIHLLPFYNPIQTAEAVAVSDQISGGRVRLGVGLGNFEPEFELYGISKKRQVRRFEEAIDLVKRAWAGEDLDFKGEFYEAKGAITPLPIGAELWIGASSEPGVRRAAKFGAPWPTDPLHNAAVMTHWASHYREAAEEHGTTDDISVVLLRDGWVGDSLAAVEKAWWPYIRAEHWFYFKEIPRWVADREPLLAGISAESDFQFDLHRRDRLVVGSPADCIESIEALHDSIGMDYLIMSFRVAAGPGHEEELECIRRFGAEVIPAFR
jgi:alkanesulfonate monooxygenase SsuD/methylene tetrahydromethanopterin reductase-like flavin-dependent oxidoreductase (luciferase family)